MTVYGGTTQTYYYVKDHLGSVQAIVDASGSIVESYRYDAWGNVLGVYDSAGSPIPQSAVSNRFLWQGREYSWKTGLYYFRARWYEPVTGRWLSNDPIGISGGLNQYVFCANNPVNFIDPLGLCEYTGSPDEPLGDPTLDWITLLTPIKIPLIGAVLGRASEFLPSLVKRLVAKSETEIIQRAMSRGELKAIQESGVLSRGERAGPHYASDAVNADALRARQRLSLSQTPEVRATIEVPSGVFSSPTRVQPKFGMPGGGMERTASGNLDIPATVLDVLGY